MAEALHSLELELDDAERAVRASVARRVARHPSETAEHLVTRLLAFALHWSPALALRDGVCHGREPALWEERPEGGLALWVDVGRPDMERLRHAISRADAVALWLCPPDETALAGWRSKHWRGQRLPALYLPPREVVLGLAEGLGRRLRWGVTRAGGVLAVTADGVRREGPLVEVDVRSGIRR